MKNIFLVILFSSIVILDVAAQSNVLTPEKLWSLGRVSDTQISPDGKWVLYGVTKYDIKMNTSKRTLYLTNINTGETKIVRDLVNSAYNARWRPDGKRIGFLTKKSGSMQLWEMDMKGDALKQVTFFNKEISNFSYSPNMGYISFSMEEKLGKTIQDKHSDLDKAEAKIYDDLMYMHWDHWNGENKSHLCYMKYDQGKTVGAIKDVMQNEKFDWPMAPFGDDNDLSWSPDETSMVYVSKKYSGTEYARNTNSDLYWHDLESGITKNITEKLPGYDKLPKFSPDGMHIAWLNMPRAGYESDRQQLRIFNTETGNDIELTQDFEYDIHDISWDANGKEIYITAGIEATIQVFTLSLGSYKFEKMTGGKNNIEQLTTGIHNVNGIKFHKGNIIAEVSSMSMPAEVYKINTKSGSMNRMTHINDSELDQLSLGKVEKRMVTTTDNKEMLTWVIYPPNFNPDRKYPTLLYCQGGPHGAVNQFFSFRWNFQIMAANGYIIVAPNRRGLPSFGDEWNDAINRDWGGQVMQDYLSAIDEISAESFVDHEHLGAVGASFGGYSVFYLAGMHESRFKTFIAHDGVFNLESMYGATEELFFPDWELGGPYWLKENANDYNHFSPHKFVQNWDTPMLIIHGEKDFRIPYTQALEAFTALRVNDIPAKLLLFPEENHWVLSAQNGILWQRTFFDWLDKWLKN